MSSQEIEGRKSLKAEKAVYHAHLMMSTGNAIISYTRASLSLRQNIQKKV